MSLREDLIALIDDETLPSTTRRVFSDRLKSGDLTRDENPASHYCVYFLPYDPIAQKVFLIAHKKSGLWLAPGGHIDRGENLFQAVNREIEEELGLKSYFQQPPHPFLITIVEIEQSTRACRRHHDVWYLITPPTNSLRYDHDEFSDTCWVGREAALKLLTDPSNIQAIDLILPA